MSKQWILTANGSIARIWGRDAADEPLTSIETINNPDGRLKGSELARDRPGHEASDKSSSAARFEPRTDPHRKVQQRFARDVAKYLDEALIANPFQELWLLASNPFFGELKFMLSPAVAKHLTFTHDSDYTSLDGIALAQRLEALCQAQA